jgi:nucleoside-diphosphate-sugar epimerase
MVYSGIKNNEIKLYIKDIIRPILGIKDLSRAIKQIIECVEDKRGIYNLASFNSIAENIAKTISDKINVPIKEYPVDPTNITNAKLQTKCYNFSINCDKFKNIFNFNFEETIETITEELKENFDKITFSSRNEFKLYE